MAEEAAANIAEKDALSASQLAEKAAEKTRRETFNRYIAAFDP